MGFNCDRWVQWFSSSLNTSSPALEPNIVEELKMWAPCTPLSMQYLQSLRWRGTITSMSNRKAVGPEELPAELFKLASDGDQEGNRRILPVEQFHAIVITIRQGGSVP